MIYKYILYFLMCLSILSHASHYQWNFPQDHGAHPNFNTEWWYFTGHLESKMLNTFGFELTFFRLSPSSNITLTNDWSPNTIYLAHFALTDESMKTFTFFERINRDSFAMAGSSQDTLNTWNGDWQVKLTSSNISLAAYTPTIQLNLNLNPKAPIILHGQQGYSIKNHEASQFSYYYSMPKLSGMGKLTINNQQHHIKQASVWFDHEFFNSNTNASTPQQQSIGKNYTGWDWFAIQSDNQTNIMIAQVRAKDNNHFYFGTVSTANGDTHYLDHTMINITVLDTWKSSKTKTHYPIKWQVSVPKHDINITITPTLKNQELVLSHLNGLNYWEGRCSVTGTHPGDAYVELVGYKP